MSRISGRRHIRCDVLWKDSTLISITAVAQAQFDNATPTRPELAFGLQTAGRVDQAEPTTTGSRSFYQQEEDSEVDLDIIQQQHEAELQAQEDRHQEVKRQNSMNSSDSTSSASEESSAASSAAASVTEVAYFTAGGAVWSASYDSAGYNVVAGKTLSAGGPEQLIGGELVTASGSMIAVDGVTAVYQTITLSATSSMAASMSSSAAAETTTDSSESAGAPESESAAASESSSEDAAPRATAGVGTIALVGAVFGALVL